MILILGFMSQALFGLRLLVQLWHSENSKSDEVPLIFWNISLWAALLYLLYGVLRQDIIIVIGQTITYFIYIRNVHLLGRWSEYPIEARIFYILIPFILVLYFLSSVETLIFNITNQYIILVGFLGQLLMNARFVLQWMYAEKKGVSAFPLAFWYISIIGSFMLLIYGIWHPKYGYDPVIILAQLMGLGVYLRTVYQVLKRHSLKAF